VIGGPASAGRYPLGAGLLSRNPVEAPAPLRLEQRDQRVIAGPLQLGVRVAQLQRQVVEAHADRRVGEGLTTCTMRSPLCWNQAYCHTTSAHMFPSDKLG